MIKFATEGIPIQRAEVQDVATPPAREAARFVVADVVHYPVHSTRVGLRRVTPHANNRPGISIPYEQTLPLTNEQQEQAQRAQARVGILRAQYGENNVQVTPVTPEIAEAHGIEQGPGVHALMVPEHQPYL